MICRLNGITFQDLPYIRCKWIDPNCNDLAPSGAMLRNTGEHCTVKREDGEIWDSEARPAYSVRLEGLHVGYIPLVETIKEEAIKARDGFRKVWKTEFQNMTKEQLREYAKTLNEKGETTKFHDWEDVGKSDELAGFARYKLRECETVEIVRDWLYCEIMRNNLTPTGMIIPTYYDEKIGCNYNEIGEICSLSIAFDGFME